MKPEAFFRIPSGQSTVGIRCIEPRNQGVGEGFEATTNLAAVHCSPKTAPQSTAACGLLPTPCDAAELLNVVPPRANQTAFPNEQAEDVTAKRPLLIAAPEPLDTPARI